MNTHFEKDKKSKNMINKGKEKHIFQASCLITVCSITVFIMPIKYALFSLAITGLSLLLGYFFYLRKNKQLIITDDTTNTFNYRYFKTIYTTKLNKVKKQPFAVAMIDIDDFKQVNDNYGYKAGDEQLKNIANTISCSLRNHDFIFRYKHGDEFIYIINNVSEKQALIVAKRIKNAVSDTSKNITISTGLYYVNKKIEMDSLLDILNKKLHIAKKNKNTIII